jgi:large subunit ribosomal protein L6
MSRVAKNPVLIPAGVEVLQSVQWPDRCEGPAGLAAPAVHPSVKVEREGDGCECSAIEGVVNSKRDVRHHARAGQQHGDRRVQGLRAQADLVGVGYRAQAQGDKLNLSLGFSHPVVHQMPAGIKVETPTQTEI